MGKRLNQPRVLNIGSTKSDDTRNHKWKSPPTCQSKLLYNITKFFFAQKYVVHMSSFMTLECLPISTIFHTSNVLTTPLLSSPPNTHVEHFKKVPSDPPTTWKPGKECWKAGKIQLFLVLVLRPFWIYNLIATKCSKSLSTKKFE
jgi:hypothetical protein